MNITSERLRELASLHNAALNLEREHCTQKTIDDVQCTIDALERLADIMDGFENLVEFYGSDIRTDYGPYLLYDTVYDLINN